jgi:hypothetical protein
MGTRRDEVETLRNALATAQARVKVLETALKNVSWMLHKMRVEGPVTDAVREALAQPPTAEKERE